MVVEYTGLNIREIGEMEMDEYLYYFRDAFIHSMNQTKEGREYLENAFISNRKNRIAQGCGRSLEIKARSRTGRRYGSKQY